ncbi:hypothetical protein [Streptomyces catenulae]|uniref:Uncharacterized protein n=1 Tax=Streptomyces catenulae TaxID=66875 RepID=A0ABV2Z2D3_9ACTN|nr:hypothetical protein [Streptomyces catenulae]
MPTPAQEPLPDIAVGHHPDFGIVATNPKQLAAGTWMLERLDFHPVPDRPTLYALADQQHDGQARATRAVALLRKAGYQVDADAAFEPALGSGAAFVRDRAPRAEPDVAFAEHPQLGVVAATGDHSSALGGRRVLEEHGWRHSPDLDIYTLPAALGRSEALEKVADATVSMHRSGLQVAVQPLLARDVSARRSPAPAARHERGQESTAHASPLGAAALAASPARTGLPGKPPVPAPAVSAAAGGPVDPRITFSRTR